MLRVSGLILALLFMPVYSFAAEMTVSAAASLTNAFTELKDLFEKGNPDVVVNTNFAASNPLLRQLVEGAPVDLFATADQTTMDKAVEAGVVDPTDRKTFAFNELVLIVPKGAPQPENLEELKKMQRIAIGNPDSVPAGRYARQALTNAKLWESVQKNLIQAENVRQALEYVARGEVDAGFVYATDAKQQDDKVDVAMNVPGHDPVSYPIAIAKTGKNPDAGRKFMDLILSEEGQKILARHGFSKP